MTTLQSPPSPLSSGDPALAAALGDLRARLAAIGEVVEALRPAAALVAQAPGVVAMAGDSFDEIVQSAAEQGIDVERGLLNGAGAALRFGASMDAGKVEALEALLNSGVLDPRGLRVMGELGRALADATAAPPRHAGLGALLKALGDPDVQRALGFLLTVARRFGAALDQPPAGRP